jgi:hypothetical protein
MAKSFRHASADEVKSGISYAISEYEITLDGDMLSSLFNRIGVLMRFEREKFPEASAIAFRETFGYMIEDSQMRKALKGAIGHMFSKRKSRKPRALTAKQIIALWDSLIAENGTAEAEDEDEFSVRARESNEHLVPID